MWNILTVTKMGESDCPNAAAARQVLAYSPQPANQ
jgi:hypothetical protein